MSGIHYTVHEALKYQMGKRFGAWSFDEITFGVPRETSAFPVDRLIDVTYRGVTRTLGYNRQDIRTITGTAPITKTLPIGDTLPAVDVLCEAIAKRYGLRLEPADVDMTKTVLEDGYLTLVVSEQSDYYTGSLRLLTSPYVDDSINRVTEEEHRWPLAGTGQPTVGTIPLTGDFRYEGIGDVTWATTAATTPLGVALSSVGDFTLTFKLYIVEVLTEPLELLEDLWLKPNDVSKCYVEVPGVAGYRNVDGANGVGIGAGKDTQVTIRGFNGTKVEVYIDGVLSCVTEDTTGNALTWTTLPELGSVRIRDIAYYDHPIDIPPTQAGTVNDLAPLTTWGLQPWYLDNLKSLAQDPNIAKFNISLRTYSMDYTPVADVLKTIPAHPRPIDPAETPTWTVDNASITLLATNLKKVDGIVWSTRALRDYYNLANSAVVYNGPVANCAHEVMGVFKHGTGPNEFLDEWLANTLVVPNPEYDNVMAIWLYTPYNASSYGAILLAHYNEV